MRTVNIDMVKNLVKVINYGKPFYASDLGLNGGQIRAMSWYDYIVPTGKTKTTWVEIYGTDLARRCTSKEWRVDVEEIRKTLCNEMLNNIELLEEARAIINSAM